MRFGKGPDYESAALSEWKRIMTKICLGVMLTSACSSVMGETSAPESADETTTASPQLRPFTVATSIESTHLEVPDETSDDHPPVSPNGKKFFVITEKGVIERNVRNYSLHVYDLERLQAKPVLVAMFDSSSNRPGISEAKWIDDQHIALIGENPAEKPQVYLFNWRTGAKKRVTSDPQGVITYDISRDQKTIAYYANWGGDESRNKYKEEHGFAVSDESLAELVNGNWRRPARFFQMYIQDLVTGTVQPIHAAPFRLIPGRLHVWLSPDATYAITEQAADNIPVSWEAYSDPIVKRVAKDVQGKVFKQRVWNLAQLMLVNIRTQAVRPLINAPSSIGSAVGVIWCSDSKAAVVASTLLPLDISDAGELARRKAHAAIAEVTVSTGSVRRIMDMPSDAWLTVKPDSLPDSFSVTGWKMEGASFTSEFASLHFRRNGDEWMEERNFVHNVPGSNIRVKQDLNHWPVLVKIDDVNHSETIVFDPNPQFHQYRFQRQELIHWQGKRGEQLMGGLFYPANYQSGVRYPLVIQTHGFSPVLFLPDGPFTTAFAAQELANKGIVVLQVGEGPLYMPNHENGDFGPVLLSQLESGVDYLDQLGMIDRDRVGLVGFSMTGFQVIYALSHSKYHFTVATSAEGNDYGYWSYVWGGDSAAWLSQVDALYGGSPWKEGKQRWLEESISFNYDKIHTPLRLEADSNDLGAVMNEWEPFIALRQLHQPVELLYVANGAHPNIRPLDRMASQQGNIDWLLYWLKGEEDPDPLKAEQYARWHELKKLQSTDAPAR